jgi:hypothetical protein
MRLPNQIVESLRPIFSGEYLVTHALNLNALIDASKQKSINHEWTRMDTKPGSNRIFGF